MIIVWLVVMNNNKCYQLSFLLHKKKFSPKERRHTNPRMLAGNTYIFILQLRCGRHSEIDRIYHNNANVACFVVVKTLAGKLDI
jgi:hypothetical protein